MHRLPDPIWTAGVIALAVVSVLFRILMNAARLIA
jgi:hypothetical protein